MLFRSNEGSDYSFIGRGVFSWFLLNLIFRGLTLINFQVQFISFVKRKANSTAEQLVLFFP